MSRVDWQPGLDWEVRSNGGTGPYAATLYDRSRALAVVTSRRRWWLWAQMAWAHWRHRHEATA